MDWLISLIMLVALEAVLGIDNLLYIAIESGRVDSSQQTRVQRIGIFGAVVMRVALLLLLVQLIQWFQLPFVVPQRVRCAHMWPSDRHRSFAHLFECRRRCHLLPGRPSAEN